MPDDGPPFGSVNLKGKCSICGQERYFTASEHYDYTHKHELPQCGPFCGGRLVPSNACNIL